jgi:BirA family biotin operon repressor/biotin-[acetyl-CoA-carboxylase] ligase
MGRGWISEPGNLYISALVRLRPTDPPVSGLALISALSAYEAARALLPAEAAPHLKWPNDLMLGDAKLCGILLERANDAVIAGFGMNVAHAPDLPDRRTMSLQQAGAAAEVDAAMAAEHLAERFAAWLARWRSEGMAPVRDAWVAAAHPLGTSLRAVCPNGETVSGQFGGLDADGALILALDDGAKRVIHAGDVFEINGE